MKFPSLKVNPDWRNTYDVCPTECEMQKDPSCNVNKSFGVASIEVKNGVQCARTQILLSVKWIGL